MKIGFDAKRAAQNATGLGNYSRFVMRATKGLFTRVAYAPKLPKDEQTMADCAEIWRTPATAWWRRLRSLWRVWGVTADIRQDGIDLFHGLSNELPLNIRRSGVRSIVTVHDLIFLRLPSCYPFFDRLIYNFKFRRACRQAHRIIAVSECTKRDIVHFYGIDPEKISVVYQGCDKAFSTPINAEKLVEVRKKYALPERYILYVGSIERRKNLKLIAEALTHLDDNYRVIAVGKRTPYAGEVEQFLRTKGIAHRLQMLHGVPFADLPALYRQATTFIYPSLYEGFGIPLLEALRSGVPVIGATGSCLEEAGGAHSIYVSPTDAVGLALAIKDTYHDLPLREQMIREGYAYAHRFDEENLVADLHAVYQRVLNEG